MTPGRRFAGHRALQFVERVLLAAGIVALSWYAGVQILTRLDQASQNRTLERLQAERAARPANTTGTTGRAAETPAPPPRRPKPAARALIGRVEIPRLRVSAMVREGVDDGTLGRAVGHIPETALPGEAGNVGLAAHRDTFFRPLERIRAGDRIRVTTPDGSHEYRVDETRIVDPSDVWVLDPTPQPTLTLVTCYPFNYVGSAPRRFIVRATSTSQAEATVQREQPSVVVTAAAVTPFLLADSSSRATAVRKTASKSSVRKPVSKKATAKRAAKKEKPRGWRKFFGIFTRASG